MESPAVRTAKPDERAAVVDVLTLAFSSDPTTRWLYPGADTFLGCFPRFTEAFGGRAFEHATACVMADFSGGSLWYPPGVEPDGDALEAVIEATLTGDQKRGMEELAEKMEQHHPKEPHWYLAVIGVDPACQGRGTGSALLRHTLGTVDEQALPAYLESSNAANIPLYQRHGFEVVAEISGGDSPMVYPMYRTAR